MVGSDTSFQEGHTGFVLGLPPNPHYLRLGLLANRRFATVTPAGAKVAKSVKWEEYLRVES